MHRQTMIHAAICIFTLVIQMDVHHYLEESEAHYAMALTPSHQCTIGLTGLELDMAPSMGHVALVA
jgi:hypothetical protein